MRLHERLGRLFQRAALRFGLPEFPSFTASGVVSCGLATFGEASALRQVENCEKPMLFIHGTADDFIPYEMMDELYNAKPGDNKAELTADGAGHETMYALGTPTGTRCLTSSSLIWLNAERRGVTCAAFVLPARRAAYDAAGEGRVWNKFCRARAGRRSTAA
ncbi:MAG: alpha/beta hydrolase [Gemmiger sp.]